MKRSILLLIVFSIFLGIKAQDYFMSGQKWVYITINCNNEQQTKEIQIGNEVIIKGKTYKKIDNIPVRTENKKVIILFDEIEYTLYDFSLEVGQTIPVSVFENTDNDNQIIMSKVISTDSVTLLNGIRAKRIIYDNRSADIEYIGSSVDGIFGPLSMVVPTCNPTFFCYCAIENEFIYKTSEQVCETISALNEVIAEDLFTINNDILTMKDVKCVSAAIYSADGRQVLSFTGNTADISSLPHGLYIVRAGTKTAKFVK